jgi:hypothetical protein
MTNDFVAETNRANNVRGWHQFCGVANTIVIGVVPQKEFLEDEVIKAYGTREYSAIVSHRKCL